MLNLRYLFHIQVRMLCFSWIKGENLGFVCVVVNEALDLNQISQARGQVSCYTLF